MPKPFDEQRFHSAVITRALQISKGAVIAHIRAEGRKLSQYSCGEINEMRELYFKRNMEELVTRAIQDCWRFPMFARYRQTQTQPGSQRAPVQ
jgi:hypothetical protein